MNKGSHFIGQPAYGQLINLLDRTEILEISRSNGGERYVKNFDVWHHLLIMLYAVIKRFDSLREITDSMFPEARKLAHLGISIMPRRSTLSDANARRSEAIFEKIYRSLYARYKDELSSDSRKNPSSSWINRLQIIDSTTVTLFSNMLFKGVGRHPKTGKKKGGIKVHTNIHANEGVPSDVKFTSAATNDSFMLKPTNYIEGDIVALDRAYIDYGKFEELTSRGVIYVTKMKKNLVYQIDEDTAYMTPEGLMEYRVKHVTFTKKVAEGSDIVHKARIVTYVDIKKNKQAKLISLLTNDMEMPVEEIVAIYHKRWEIELLFYDKYIVMQSQRRSTSDIQHVMGSLLTLTSHNNSHRWSPFSHSRRSLFRSHVHSESLLGVRSVYAFSRASRLAFESARAYMSVVCIDT